jgi:predicted enzyme related to lactoylglutathione lyase
MNTKMNPVVHFEMPAENMKRMTDFYSNVFGWQAQTMGEEMGNYVVVTTSETDEKGRPKMPGSINGGFYPKQNGQPANHPSVVIAVDNIKEAIGKVLKAGGKVINEPTTIPGVGLYVSIFDTEGNLVSLLQPEMR